MHLLPPPLSRTRRGSALAATMMVVLALLTLLSISALVTSQFGRFVAREEGDNELMAAGDASLEYLYAQWQTTTASVFNKGIPPVSGDFSRMDSTLLTSLNSTSLPFAAAGINFSVARIRLANVNGVEDTTSSSAIGTPTYNVPNYPGWTGTTYTYMATVRLSPASTGYHYGFFSGSMPTLTLTRMFQVTQVPLFQAAIFYENKLEIHPGASMTVTGPVHTNDDLWARGFNDLTFQSDVSYVGGYNAIGDASVTKGWDGFNFGQIPGVNAGTNPMPTYGAAADLNQVSPIDPFGGADQSDNKLHKIIDPKPTDTSNKQLAYNNASLIITIDSTPASKTPVTITDGSGGALSDTDYKAVLKAVTVGGNTFYDQRETVNVRATSLDMSKLAAATVLPAGTTTGTNLQNAFATSQADPNKSNVKRASGTVYIYDKAADSTTIMPAIRLTNGSVLGQDVTVASSNPVYILGDYNTGGTGTNVVSNQSGKDGTIPTIAGSNNGSGYNRYSSAVMADAVTILSSGWQDSASTLPLYVSGNYGTASNKRVAAATTVNTAILSGDLPSNYGNNGYASGGAHNFPRFLENWSNVNFTYYGSLVEAFRSTTANSHWQTNNVYYWPNRRWWFDTNFLTTQPPGVPNGISYSRGRWTRTNG